MSRLASVALGAALLTAACAVPTTGVVPRSEDMYTVTRQGGSALVQTMSLTAEAAQEGVAYCSKSGKQYRQIHVKEIPAGPLGRWPESEVLFRCE